MEKKPTVTKFCPHCDEVLSSSGFYRHKALYYIDGNWNKKKSTSKDDEEGNLSSSGFSNFNNDQDQLFIINENFENNGCISPESNDNSSEEYDDAAAYYQNAPEVWISNEEPENDFLEVHNEEEDTNSNTTVTVIIAHLLLAWQMTFKVSDRCLECLLKLIHFMLQMIHVLTNSEVLESFILVFPGTLYKVKRILGFDNDDFEKYVCCPQCNKLYGYDSAYYKDRDGVEHSNFCDFVRFKNHPQQRMRDKCGTELMKKVVSIDGKKHHLYPYKVYNFQPLRKSLERLISCKDILKDIRRKINLNNDFLFDIYDGNFWKEATDIEGNPYFKDCRNLGGMINVDWFLPFDNSEHSVGVIYMVLLNLSREIKFKRENVIIIGIIPGPKETELNINSFLKPFVEELQLFWKGVYLKENGEEVLYRFVLVCGSSDLPATRKCCGFMSYNAFKGCSKCLKEFPRDSSNEPDYSGYDIATWTDRKQEDHREHAEKIQKAETKAAKSKLESSTGVRYSELLKLPYFDPIRGHCVDPMHNL